MYEKELISTLRDAFRTSPSLQKPLQKVRIAELEAAAQKLEEDNYKDAAELVKQAIERIECAPCQRKLGALTSDILHLETVCQIDQDSCRDDRKRVKKKLRFYKDVYIPTAEALRVRAKETETATEIERAPSEAPKAP